MCARLDELVQVGDDGVDEQQDWHHRQEQIYSIPREPGAWRKDQIHYLPTTSFHQ